MLTDAHCKNARCSPALKRERLSDSGGLYLEVSPTGSKRWFWKYRINGKEGRMALGSYPSVGLTAARKARDAAKLQKAEGVDPVKARKVERLKASNPAGDTFKVVALEWYERQKGQWSEGHAERSLRQFERDLFPWLGERRLCGVADKVKFGHGHVRQHRAPAAVVAASERATALAYVEFDGSLVQESHNELERVTIPRIQDHHLARSPTGSDCHANVVERVLIASLVHGVDDFRTREHCL